MLQRDILHPQAAALFEVLKQSPELDGLTLIGGTALALQLGHRMSLDFDFATFAEHLPVFSLDRLVDRLKQEGHNINLVTEPAKICQFKINTGMNLLDLARDYVMNGIKVTFFTHGKNASQKMYYANSERVQEEGMSFDLLGLPGLKVAKTLVLADRVRSRDLYDLYILMRDHGLSVSELLGYVDELSTNNDPEYYKAILRGEMPLDRDDEGLEPVDLIGKDEQMYTFFIHAVNEYEVSQAREHFQKSPLGPSP